MAKPKENYNIVIHDGEDEESKEKICKVLAQYEQVAVSLKNKINKFVDLVKKVQEDCDYAIAQKQIPPFISVVAPPGSGKSQIPFSLHAKKIKCLRLVCGRSHNPQDIYKPCYTLSTEFQDLCDDDVRSIYKIA